MITQRTAVATGLGCRALGPRVPGCVSTAQVRKVLVRFRENDEKIFDLQEELLRRQNVKSEDLQRSEDIKRPADIQPDVPTDSKLSPQQLEEVYAKEPGNISPRMAELRADLGTAATDLSQLQTFDGPAPETVNGRLAMLGVLTGLIGEWTTGAGLLQQTADHPITVFASFIILSIATYVPLIKGYTRKEPFSNNLLGLSWTPKAENWNGRLAMLGFTGMVLTEAISGMNTLQAWGLQPTNIPGMH